MLCFFGPSHDRHDFIHQKPEASCTAHTGSRAKKFYRDGSRPSGGNVGKPPKFWRDVEWVEKKRGNISKQHIDFQWNQTFFEIFGVWGDDQTSDDTVDGSEIPVNSPVEGKVVEIPLFTGGFVHLKWLFGISEPSTVSKQHIYKTKNKPPSFKLK